MTAAKRELVLVAAGFVALTIALTFPLALNLKRALPSDLADTLLATWILGWDADRLRHGLRGVWDTPIFFPYRGTLAFAETLFGLAIFVAPLYWVAADAETPATNRCCSNAPSTQSSIVNSVLT